MGGFWRQKKKEGFDKELVHLFFCKDKEQKQLSPSTTQDTAEKEVVSFNKLKEKERKEVLKNMTDDEREDWLDGLTIDGIKIEDIKHPKTGLGISPEGMAAFKKEKEPKPADDIKAGEVPELR